MADYRKAYFLLFNAITDAVREFEEGLSYFAACGILEQAQLEAEELIISQPDPEDETEEPQ